MWVQLRSLRALAMIMIVCALAGCGAAQRGSSLTLVLGHPSAVVIAEYRSHATHHKTVQVQDVGKVSSLARELNKSLRLEPGRTIACPSGKGTYDVLRFQFPNRDRWTVMVDTSGCPFDFFQGGPEGWASEQLLNDLNGLLSKP